jgi:hypothetical protein
MMGQVRSPGEQNLDGLVDPFLFLHVALRFFLLAALIIVGDGQPDC